MIDPARLWARRGPLACLLWPLSRLYAAAAAYDRWRHRRGGRTGERLPVPVLVVGNLIAGGAGKTPTVIATVMHLRASGWHPGVISRGYRRDGDAVLEVQPDTPATRSGDEPLLIRLRTGVPVVVGRDRVAAGRALLAAHPVVDVIVSDDGLQHHRLARDAAVLVFDERGAGNGWLLPAGPLREPLPAQVPAGQVVLYNAGAPSTPLPGHVAARQLGGAVRLDAWWRGEQGSAEHLQSLRGRALHAVCGLAHPARFFAMLTQAGLQFEPHAVPDHDRYAQLPWPDDDRDVVVTEKDAVKLVPARVAAERPRSTVWVLALDFRPPRAYFDDVDRALALHRAIPADAGAVPAAPFSRPR